MKILLCDEHRMVREGVRAMLERAGLTVVGEAHCCRQLLSLCQQLQPDVVVLETFTPDSSGIDATRELSAEQPHVRVVGLSVSVDPGHVAALFAAGAIGYVPKSAGGDELVRALHAVAEGFEYRYPAVANAVDAGATQNAAHGAPPSSARPLSSRERDVLELLANGKSSKEIAAGLDIGVTTVETHRRQIMDKLRLRTIAELTKYAVKAGLTSLD